MTLAEEIADDWKDCDGLEVVTLKRARADGGDELEISYVDDDGETQGAALRRQTSRREQMALAGSVSLEDDLVTFELPVSIVGSLGVRQRDIIVDADGRVWRVVKCDLASLKTRWRCICQE